MSDPIATLEAVSKLYGQRPALSDLTFEIHEGEGIGYLGPNGAGKTTTLRLLTGLCSPDSGRVRVSGIDPSRDPVGALRHVGALIETPGLLPFLHGRDLLAYAADVRGLAVNDRPGEIRRAAERMGVEEVLDRPVGGLSTGLARRVLLASTLLGEPRLLLLDEPTLGLDPAARRDLRGTLAILRSEGRTFLLSTHLLEDVEATCGRVLFLRDGHLVGDESVTPKGPPDRPGGRREMVLRFLGPVPATAVQPLLQTGEDLAAEGPDVLRITLLGGEERSVELINAVVGRGLPLRAVSPAGSELEQRYLRAVGREEEP